MDSNRFKKKKGNGIPRTLNTNIINNYRDTAVTHNKITVATGLSLICDKFLTEDAIAPTDSQSTRTCGHFLRHMRVWLWTDQLKVHIES